MRHLLVFATLVGATFAATPAHANAALPLRKNDSVVTSADGVYVAGAHDPVCTDPSPAPWNVDKTLIASSSAFRDAADPPGFEDRIFGAALRPSNADPTVFDIFVAASQFYDAGSASGSSRIYRINGETGGVSEFASLAGNDLTTFGIGGLAYNPTHDVMYAVDSDAGTIYVIDIDSNGTSGTIQSSYDPFDPAATHAGDPIAPLGERLSALGWNDAESRLYYARWFQDEAAPKNLPNAIFSQPVDGQGDILDDIAAANGRNFEELKLPTDFGFSSPATDIEFSDDGARMLVATRSLNSSLPGVISLGSGTGSVYEWVGGHDLWSDPTIDPPLPPSGNTFGIGSTGSMASGGVDYDAAEANACNAGSHVIATADHLGDPTADNGLQLLPASGGTLATSSLAIMDVGVLADVEVCGACPPHPVVPIPALTPALRLLLMVLLASAVAVRARRLASPRG